MSENKSQSNPLLYIVQPNIGQQPQHGPEMQKEFRSKKRKRVEPQSSTHVNDGELARIELDGQERKKKEEEDRKFEEIKHEFGVYETMKEIAKEIEAVKRLTDSSLNGNINVNVSPHLTDTVEQLEKKQSVDKIDLQSKNTSIKTASKPVSPENKIEPVKENVSIEQIPVKADLTRMLQNVANFKRPLCEAKIKGELTRFHVISMRGNTIKIKAGLNVYTVEIDDISDFKIL
jgi:hypothetical protein